MDLDIVFLVDPGETSIYPGASVRVADVLEAPSRKNEFVERLDLRFDPFPANTLRNFCLPGDPEADGSVDPGHSGLLLVACSEVTRELLWAVPEARVCVAQVVRGPEAPCGWVGPAPHIRGCRSCGSTRTRLDVNERCRDVSDLACRRMNLWPKG